MFPPPLICKFELTKKRLIHGCICYQRGCWIKQTSLELSSLQPSHSLITMTALRVCLCFRRKFRPTSNDPPESIKHLFNVYSNGNSIMIPDQLQKFMVEVQGDANATGETAQQIINSQKEYFRYVNVFQRKGFNLDAFFKYLFSDDNLALKHSSEVHQDMTAPISHYFIYTGHNSYLTGNQLSSESSDIPIIISLLRGVRVIELDLWPNNAKTDVEVRHGRTLTTPVELSKCLKSIKEHAFVSSCYPVVITLEDHLTSDLQAKVAVMIKETFEDVLFCTTSDSSLEKFPSPEELKLRILISTKVPRDLHEESKSSDDIEIEERKFSEELSEDEDNNSAENESLENEDHDAEDNRFTQSMEYKDLIGITAIKGNKNLSEMLKADPHKVTRLSLSEQLFQKAVKTYGPEIIRFTQRNILRIYPRGTRVRSGNYRPMLGWVHGAQMVALNMQGYGKSLWLMHGMFRANGGCGYVKKPNILLETDINGKVFNPKSPLPVKTILKVTVCMGDGWRFDFHHTHFDTYSPPDFYARIGIAGVRADTTMKETKKIEDNWMPFWDEEFVFQLTVPELALLRIEVYEHDLNKDDDFGGQTCLPVWELKKGIRAVCLYDKKGDKLNHVKLLMRFDFVHFV